MRHRVSHRKLGRLKKERTALMKGLIQDVILHGHIRTTEAKAKEMKPQLERLITQTLRSDDKTAIRNLQKTLTQEEAMRKVMTELKPRFAGKTSGFVRIRKVGYRKGDAATLVQVELL